MDFLRQAEGYDDERGEIVAVYYKIGLDLFLKELLDKSFGFVRRATELGGSNVLAKVAAFRLLACLYKEKQELRRALETVELALNLDHKCTKTIALKARIQMGLKDFTGFARTFQDLFELRDLEVCIILLKQLFAGADSRDCAYKTISTLHLVLKANSSVAEDQMTDVGGQPALGEYLDDVRRLWIEEATNTNFKIFGNQVLSVVDEVLSAPTPSAACAKHVFCCLFSLAQHERDERLNPQLALQMFEKCKAMVSRTGDWESLIYPEVLRNMAWCHFRLGETVAMTDTIQRALAADPKDPKTHVMALALAIQIKDEAAALRHLETLHQLNDPTQFNAYGSCMKDGMEVSLGCTSYHNCSSPLRSSSRARLLQAETTSIASE
eukprot:c15291_g1_i1.p1 GENE.c15291_g1_i1~~c15291_g1_i1.p1  ORF type:complete len:409 (-),score=61.14 c15291_g1_i1:852-1994(-)